MAALWGQIVSLFMICGVGFSCVNEWIHFNGSCFKIMYDPLTNEDAEESCRHFGSESKLVNGIEFYKIINLQHILHNETYWVSNNSWTDDAHKEHRLTSEDLCPYAEMIYDDDLLDQIGPLIGKKDESCTVKKPFVCEYVEAAFSCPNGYDKYSLSCLEVISNLTNYSDAVNKCTTDEGKLAAWNSELEYLDITGALKNKSTEYPYFVDATTNTGSKRQYYIKTSILHENDSMDTNCTGLVMEGSSFIISSVGCEKGYFICKVDSVPLTSILKVDPVTSTLPPPTTTTLAPLECPHGQNWKSHEESGFCFWETTYESERLNWYEAREFCKLYGGDLASYVDTEQEAIGLGGARGHYKGLWIGLKRDENDVFHWTDGTTLNFSNWAFNQPKLSSKTKYCVVHGAGHSKWELDYCGVRRWFVCKAPKVSRRIPVAVPTNKKKACNIQDVSIYSKDWYEFENHCYMAHTGKYTWDTAQNFCKDNGGHMASIHSFNETNFILNLIGLFPDSNYWIGLSAQDRIGPLSSYSWSDNAPFDFIYWADDSPTTDDDIGINSCVSFNKRDGSWVIEHCNRLQSVICRRGVNVTYDFMTTEPSVVLPGNCENGWYSYGNKCYKYFAKLWTQRETWKNAKEKCDYMNASLVSIHSKPEQDIITDIVLDANTELWIGLESREMGTVYHWSDNSRMDYTNWDVGEPAYSRDSDLFLMPSSNTLCVVMEHSETSMGKWNDISCLQKRAYLCQKMKNPTITEYQDPFLCPNMTGWYRLGSACYGIFDELKLPWLQAQAECRKHGANLVTYQNAAVSVFVQRKLESKGSYFWIGLRETEENTYKYITGSPIFYSNWMATQPVRASSLFDNCAVTTAKRGWLVKSCKESHPFICKTEEPSSEGKFIMDEETKNESTINRKCSDEFGVRWFGFGGTNCYLLELDFRKSWTEAMHYCFRHGGSLASLHSREDMLLLLKKIQAYQVENSKSTTHAVHIGFGRQHDGSYAWIDNSAVDFTNWEDDEPIYTIRNCVRMYESTGVWATVDCDDANLNFICSKRSKKSFEPGVNASVVASQYTNDLNHKLTAGGIFGIIVCVTVIAAIVGLTVYYMRRPSRKEIQPKLLEQEPPL